MVSRSATKILSLFVFVLVLLQSNYAIGQDYPPVIITIADTCGFRGETVCVDFTIDNCENVEGLNFLVSYDPTILKIDTVDLDKSLWPTIDQSEFVIYDSIAGGTAAYGAGNISFLYFNGPVVTLADGSNIFTLCFKIIGQPGEVSPVIINQVKFGTEVTQTSKTDPTQAPATILNWKNGSVKVKTVGVDLIAKSCGSTNNANNNGSITFTPVGGKAPYSYTVNGGTATTGIGEGQQVFLSNLVNATYTIIVTDALGIPSPAKVIVIDQTLPIEYDVIAKNPTCFHNATQNGSIEIIITDGGAYSADTYDFAWSVFEFDRTKINELGSGQYSVTMTDPAGCSTIDTFNLAATPITYNVEVIDALCAGKKTGEIKITNIQGGIGGPYKHYFAGLDKGAVNIFPNLAGGKYDIRVADGAPCSTPIQTINVKFMRDLTLSAVTTDVSCGSKEDGTVTVTGTPANLRFEWKLNNLGGFVQGPTDNTYVNNALGGGLYSLYAIDPDGCRDTVSFTIKDSAPIFAKATIIQPDCVVKGTISFQPTGGTGPYTYMWDPPQSNNPSSVVNLLGGTFKVTITDANNCSKDTIIILNDAGSVNVTLSKQDVSCDGKNDGRANVTILASGMIDITWRDGNNVALGPKTNTITNLAPGNYTVEVKDLALNCNKLIPFTILGSQPLSWMPTITQAKCFGDTSSITVAVPGVTDATYEWIKGGEPLTIVDTDNVLKTILAGDYKVTIKYGSGCEKDTTFRILPSNTVNFQTPSTRKVSCFGFSDGQAAVLSPPPGVIFSWSSGEVGPFALTYPAGIHWVIGSDNNGCKSDTVFFEIFTFDRLMVDDGFSVIKRPTCFGDKDGSIAIQAIGGTGVGYKYKWFNPASTDPMIAGLGVGDYIVEISDNNNCVYRDTVVLDQPQKLTAEIDNIRSVFLDCNNTDKGKLYLNISGGNPGVKKAMWQSGVLVENGAAIELAPGTYCATISDNLGCQDTACYTLSAPAPLRGEVNEPDPIVCNGSTTCISIKSITGGTGNDYRFQIITGGDKLPIDSCVMVQAGSYFIQMIDSAGCSIDTFITIPQPDPVSIDVGADQELQLGYPPIILNAIIDTPLALDTIIWSPNSFVNCLTLNCQSASVAPTSTTTYTISVVDANGCTGTDQITINVKDVRNVYFANAFSPNGDGANDYFQMVVGPDVLLIKSFQIFDRWGNLMHQQENYLPDPAQTDGWDGTLNGDRLDPGVFVFIATVDFIDGVTSQYRGSVTLMDKRKN
jgi:gliding motility-associated-like protein